jgi:hypothetical protein
MTSVLVAIKTWSEKPHAATSATFEVGLLLMEQLLWRTLHAVLEQAFGRRKAGGFGTARRRSALSAERGCAQQARYDVLLNYGFGI